MKTEGLDVAVIEKLKESLADQKDYLIDLVVSNNEEYIKNTIAKFIKESFRESLEETFHDSLRNKAKEILSSWLKKNAKSLIVNSKVLHGLGCEIKAIAKRVAEDRCGDLVRKKVHEALDGFINIKIELNKPGKKKGDK